MTELIVRSGGLSTTVQDIGRDGYYDIGMPPSGAMDQYSYRVANMLVGNPDGAAALKATYIGPEVEFTDDRLVAVTGASGPVMLNGEPVEPWQTLSVRAGDVLGFSVITSGARLYIAVSGGVDVLDYLESRSTYTLTGIGGFGGRKLAAADRLPLGKPGDNGAPRPGSSVPEELRPTLRAETEVRAVVGLCSYRLTEAGLHSFLEVTWKVTKDADRIGYRLRGGELEFVERRNPRAPEATRPMSSISAIRSVPCRFRAVTSRSCCSTTPSPEAATRRSPPSSRWTATSSARPRRATRCGSSQ